MLRFERFLVRFLRRRGWIVFWLDKPARKCRHECWLELYLAEENRNSSTRSA